MVERFVHIEEVAGSSPATVTRMWTIIDFLKRFTVDLVRAIIFSALEYDDQLKLQKTTGQRILIWFGIGCVAVIVGTLVLRGAWYMIDTIDTRNIRLD